MKPQPSPAHSHLRSRLLLAGGGEVQKKGKAGRGLLAPLECGLPHPWSVLPVRTYLSWKGLLSPVSHY